MALLESFLRHARNIGAMTAEEMDAVRAGVASGSETESAAIEAWTGRVREGEWEYYKGVTWGPPTDKTRFKVGDKVYACMGEGAWVRAVVRKVWVCEEDWCECMQQLGHTPEGRLAMAYGMDIEGDNAPCCGSGSCVIHAPIDSASCVISRDKNPTDDMIYDKAVVLGYGDRETFLDWAPSGYGGIHVCAMYMDDHENIRRLLRRSPISYPECDPNARHNRVRESPLCMAAIVRWASSAAHHPSLFFEAL